MLRILSLCIALSACAAPEAQVEGPPATAAASAPSSLRAELASLAAPYGTHTGVAVHDLTAGWTASINGDHPFQQQSVFKTWVAAAVLDAADRGDLRLDERVRITPAHLVYPYRPIEREVGSSGRDFTLEELIRWSVIHSDNAAVDALLDRLGGPGAVQAYMQRKSITGIRVDMDERGLHKSAADFRAAFTAAPPDRKAAVLAEGFADLRNTATPDGTALALARLRKGELLSSGSTALLLTILSETVTGPERLKAGIGPGWRLAHKTGGGGDVDGATLGTNDVGLLTAPDGRTYAVAVFIWGARKPMAEREALIAGVARAVVRQAGSAPA